MITGNDTLKFRKLMLFRGLDLEVKTGMKLTNKANVFKIIKQEYNLKGSKEKVLAQFKEILTNEGVLS